MLVNKCPIYHNAKCMTYRLTRKKKIIKDTLSNGDNFKVVACPSKFPKGGYLWLVSMAAAKSNRAINDWIKERNKRKRVKKLNYFHPKKRDVKALRIAVNAAKKLMTVTGSPGNRNQDMHQI